MQFDITNPRHYDILSALRGPDNENSAIKHVYTARIRYLIGVTYDMSVGVAEYRPDVRTDSKIKREKAINAMVAISNGNWSGHYVRHINDALYAMITLGIGDPDEMGRLLQSLSGDIVYLEPYLVDG